MESQRRDYFQPMGETRFIKNCHELKNKCTQIRSLFGSMMEKPKTTIKSKTLDDKSSI